MKHKVVIYVHARNNVIRPTDIEVPAEVPVSSHARTTLAQDIATQIEKAFPKSQARQVSLSIVPIIKQAYWAAEPPILAGVVLKVPGTIEDHRTNAGGSAMNKSDMQAKIDEIQHHHEQLLQKYQNKITELEADLQSVHTDKKIFETRIERFKDKEGRTRANDLEAQIIKQKLNEKEQQVKDVEKQLATVRTQRDELLTSKSELETRLEQATQRATQSEKMVATLNAEISQLRVENTLLAKDKKALEREKKKEEPVILVKNDEFPDKRFETGLNPLNW